MMSREHVTPNDLQALRGGGLDAVAILDLTRHIALCPECAATARGSIHLSRSVRTLRAEIEGDRHPDLERDLIPYVEGTIEPDRLRDVRLHLRECALCRETLADLRSERTRMSGSGPHVTWLSLAAAAAVAIVVVSLLLSRRTATPASAPPSVIAVPGAASGHSDWDALVQSALRAGRIDRPEALQSVRAQPDLPRGDTPAHERAALAPAGIVVETTRPRFTWPSRGERAVVTIYDGTTFIAQSDVLRTSSWTPDKPLKRGRTYTWQVELTSGRKHRLLPHPPEPPALMHIADEATAAAIDDARRTRPDDHLLRAVLEARGGLQADALHELALHLSEHPDDQRARALAASIAAW